MFFFFNLFPAADEAIDKIIDSGKKVIGDVLKKKD